MAANGMRLESLRIFEAAARHLSFKAAAAELNMTPAAVSQRIRILETDLGVRLFHRRTRQVVLTEEGALLVVNVRVGLAVLTDAVEAVSRRSPDRPLVVSTTPTFAEQCLLPILGKFGAVHPDIDVRIMVTSDLVDLDAERVDLAIRQGSGNYPGLEVRPLFEGRYVPVCTAKLSRRLESARLIDVDWPLNIDRAPSWKEWIRRQGDIPCRRNGSLHVGTEAMAVKAAAAGQGVALVNTRHAEHELAAGTLVRPFGPSVELKSNLAYYMVRSRRSPRASANVFWLWILSQYQDKE